MSFQNPQFKSGFGIGMLSTEPNDNVVAYDLSNHMTGMNNTCNPNNANVNTNFY